MEWIANNWYIIIIGLVAAMFLLGRKPRGTPHEGTVQGHQHGAHGGEKNHKGGRGGCCH
jgi:hypothetical protein